jgi:hemerythrin superfamily protein
MTDTTTPGDIHAPDVVDELTDDHHQVLELLRSINTVADADDRRDRADTAIAEVVRHSVAEEMYVYPAMSEHLHDGPGMVEHDKEEHAELESLMKRLEGVPGDDPQFAGLVDEMIEALQHHASDEESTQFPMLRAGMSEEQLVELRHKVQTAKKIAPTRPHPDAPNSELFHKLVGPGVGLVDRLRDRIAGRHTG